MRILIDSKDLINIVEHHRPFTPSDFTAWLRAHDHQVVYTMTNISELAAPLRERDADILDIRGLLQAAESLPHRYLREGTITRQELTAGINAFLERREYEPIDPYVTRWDQTLMPTGDSPLQGVVNYRLDDIVLLLWRSNPDTLLHSRAHSNLVINRILEDRALPANELRTAQQNFPYSLREKRPDYRGHLTEEQMDALATWLYASPQRIPGHRISYEMYHALRANTTDRLTQSDLPDLAHTYALPYVNAATMDRRMTGYTAQVQQRLAKTYADTPPATPIYRDIEQLMAANN